MHYVCCRCSVHVLNVVKINHHLSNSHTYDFQVYIKINHIATDKVIALYQASVFPKYHFKRLEGMMEIV